VTLRGLCSLIALACCLAACAEELQAPAAPAKIPEQPPPPKPIALTDAAKAWIRVAMIAPSAARDEFGADANLSERDRANGVLERCASGALKPHAEAATVFKPWTVVADIIPTGVQPNRITNEFVNQMRAVTRVWNGRATGFDFYRILSDDRRLGLSFDRTASSCLRFSRVDGETRELVSDLLFQFTFDPDKPQIIRLMPLRVYFRRFDDLARRGADEAAIKVLVDLQTMSLERTGGRMSRPINDQEVLVGLFRRSDAGEGPIYRLYDATTVPPEITTLPPWDYSAKSENPRHNYSVARVAVTEYSDIAWLRAHLEEVWPRWEYAATDVSRILDSDRLYSYSARDPK